MDGRHDHVHVVLSLSVVADLRRWGALQRAGRQQALALDVPVPTALQTTQRSFPVSGAGIERCLRFRVSNLSTTAWSPGRCTALPTDDRSLTRKGSTTQAKSRLAIAGTYTQLAKQGASLTLAKPAGRKVGLWLLRGPGQGTANVYAGSRLIGRVSGALRTNRRDLVVLAPGGRVHRRGACRPGRHRAGEGGRRLRAAVRLSGRRGPAT